MPLGISTTKKEPKSKEKKMCDEVAWNVLPSDPMRRFDETGNEAGCLTAILSFRMIDFSKVEKSEKERSITYDDENNDNDSKKPKRKRAKAR